MRTSVNISQTIGGWQNPYALFCVIIGPFHNILSDNIISSSIAMFSVWSMQGWTTLWYWAMDATYVDEAPAKDYGTVTAFCFFASFIMWNSLMLTNLFTSMLCGVFARKI